MYRPSPSNSVTTAGSGSASASSAPIGSLRQPASALPPQLTPLATSQAIDPSDFPALSSAGVAGQTWPNIASNNSIQQQQQQQQPGTATRQFSVPGPEDFPALGGLSSSSPIGQQPSSATSSNTTTNATTTSATTSSTLSGNGEQASAVAALQRMNGQLPPSQSSQQPQSLEHPRSSATPFGQQLLDVEKHSHHQQNGSTSTSTTSSSIQTPAQQVLFSPADRFGLLGLLQLIKTRDPDLGMMGLGTDLTTLGLDLGATDNLYSTFITPFTSPASASATAGAKTIEPEFHLPACYNVQPPPAQTKMGNFSDETLFFLFYNHPRDVLQELAAVELYKHNWRYHKELRLWLTKEVGTEATQKTQSYERGSYIFFDPSLWERVRKDFVLVFDNLESRRA
ncbi:hypothetical protein T439DRAFT_325465 [Meredithblackwellia eburnea MCA 4105]